MVRKARSARTAGKVRGAEVPDDAAPARGDAGTRKEAMADLFGLDPQDGMNSNPRGRQPIMLTVLPVPEDPALAAMIPAKDPNHVFAAEAVKSMMIALELNMTCYAFGPAGTGKTTLFQQGCARTNRPVIRVQHTETTEEAHILGQWTVRDGSTVFQPGPLPLAMREGICFLADEFDFGLPSVLAAYHPVMEGAPLIIKDAPAEWRVVKPHPEFRFVGTGNTNGTGDPSGLYQGTRQQNSALFSRWAVTEELGYVDAEAEVRIIMGQARIPEATAGKFVEFAKAVRDAFAGQRIGSTVGPRELIHSARIGLLRGGDWRKGLANGFTNRLSAIDKLAVDQLAQRIFG